MTMPKWYETMRPTLEALARTNGMLTSSDLMNATVKAFSMTPEERAERLKSGQLRVHNRVYWGITDLEKAKYLSYGNKRGTYLITDEGRAFLEQHEGVIKAADLERCSDAFRAWRESYRAREKAGDQQTETPEDPADQVSPEETIEQSCAELKAALAEELLASIARKDPFFFERLVSRVLTAMGYGEPDGSGTEVTPKSGDEGIDGIIHEDRLGFSNIYYQAKRYSMTNPVGRPELQSFVGALSAKGATRGLFITTGRFSDAARRYAENLLNQKLVLVDGHTLANLMIDYGVGVSTKAVYEVKSIDTDFFEEE